jgi:hypothetical protein
MCEKKLHALMNVKVNAGIVFLCPFDEDERFNNGQERVRAVLSKIQSEAFLLLGEGKTVGIVAMVFS